MAREGRVADGRVGGQNLGGNTTKLVPPSTPSGKTDNDSEIVTATASAVMVKIGRLEAVGKRLVVCQELGLFFKELEREGVGTRCIESKARKLTEEQSCKNLRREGSGIKVGTTTDNNKLKRGNSDVVEKGKGKRETGK